MPLERDIHPVERSVSRPEYREKLGTDFMTYASSSLSVM